MRMREILPVVLACPNVFVSTIGINTAAAQISPKVITNANVLGHVEHSV
jgi:hypothetical protein